MKINMHIESTSSPESKQILYGLIMEFCEVHHIKHSRSLTLNLMEEGFNHLKQWAKETKNLSISKMVIGDAAETHAIVFDIKDDQYLTEYLLKRENQV